ncbi:MAG: sigma factor-like helix-turn-helix DNA-binding protein [Candidatus Latescibacterota bacterium]
MYVDILKYLYDGHISQYEGRAPLASWLIVVSKCIASDFARKQNGRYRTPKGFKYLSEFDREVLQLYYAERLSMEVVIQMLNWSRYSFRTDDLVKSIQHIETVMDHRYLERLDMEHKLRTSNANSVSALKYITHLRHDYEERIADNSVDETLMRKDAEEAAQRVWALISKLSREEQKVIKLRFERNKSAQEISDIMGLHDRRKAYTIIDRATRKLKVLAQTLDERERAEAEGRL